MSNIQNKASIKKWKISEKSIQYFMEILNETELEIGNIFIL